MKLIIKAETTLFCSYILYSTVNKCSQALWMPTLNSEFMSSLFPVIQYSWILLRWHFLRLFPGLCFRIERGGVKFLKQVLFFKREIGFYKSPLFVSTKIFIVILNSRVRCPMKGRGRTNINALDVWAKTKMEIDQEAFQSNVSINEMCVCKGCINEILGIWLDLCVLWTWEV